MYTQVRVQPLKSCEKDSKKYSFSRSLAHDLREYNEEHIDKNLKNKNIFMERGITKEKIFQRLESLKQKYEMPREDSTIDVANYVFTVNKKFFEEDEKRKPLMLIHVQKFLEKECGKDAVLFVVGHDDEDGYHVHAYAVPLHETRRKTKYKDEKKTLINYRGKYSHTREELAEFRKNKIVDKTKTGELQTRWAEFAQTLFPELERGKRQSEKKHVTPKEYRKMIEKEIPEIERNISEKKNEISEMNSEISKLRSKKYTVRNEVSTIEEEKKNLEKIVDELNMNRYRIQFELSEIEKERQKEFRQIQPQEIAKILGRKSYPSHVKDKKGNTRKIANAFDYLVYVEGMTFPGATKFLCEYFPQERTTKTIEKIFNSEKPIMQKFKEDAITKQMESLGNPAVRITAQKTDENGEKIGINLSKDPTTKEEFFYNVEQLKGVIPTLNRYNAEGWNIYITPIENEFSDNFSRKIFFLVDDVQDIERMKRTLGEPNLILETSPNNFQAIYTIDNEINYNTSKRNIEKQREIYNQIFKHINRQFGDVKISGLRHCMRLAGYANNKPNREGNFVKIIEKNPNAKNNLAQMLESFREKSTTRETTQKRPPERPKISHEETPSPDLDLAP